MSQESHEPENKRITSVSSYYSLGRSGLRVSPICLGTMTFGTEWGWGSAEDAARQMFDRYIEAGGNFIDTADLYTNGASERMLGRFMHDAHNRHQLVVATKYTFNGYPDDPNAGGNSRKHMMDAVHASLRRLQTEYIDLYWVHAWDGITPVEEVMYSLDTLVRSGKVRYIGLSDTPAWYLARAQSLAEFKGWERICALQLEYSLITRSIEREHVPAALEFGMGICPWSPLGGGILTGKYRRPTEGELTDGRLKQQQEAGSDLFRRLSERNFAIVDVLVEVANELGRSPAQVAINWATRRRGVISTIIGATKLSQLEDNLGALEFDIPESLAVKLEEVSIPEPEFPYMFFEGRMSGMVHGNHPVSPEPQWYRG